MAKAKGPNIREFNKRFPDEDTCLNHLMRTRFGERLTCFKCQKQATSVPGQGTPLLHLRALRLSGLSDRRNAI